MPSPRIQQEQAEGRGYADDPAIDILGELFIPQSPADVALSALPLAKIMKKAASPLGKSLARDLTVFVNRNLKDEKDWKKLADAILTRYPRAIKDKRTGRIVTAQSPNEEHFDAMLREKLISKEIYDKGHLEDSPELIENLEIGFLSPDGKQIVNRFEFDDIVSEVFKEQTGEALHF